MKMIFKMKDTMYSWKDSAIILIPEDDMDQYILDSFNPDEATNLPHTVFTKDQYEKSCIKVEQMRKERERLAALEEKEAATDGE